MNEINIFLQENKMILMDLYDMYDLMEHNEHIFYISTRNVYGYNWISNFMEIMKIRFL